MISLLHIGSLLKKSYRLYGALVLERLEMHGFTDLRPSFLDILIFLSEKEAPTIKEIGQSCGLKKQTMTSHLNELQRRGYIVRKASAKDKREQRVYLTEYGEKLQFTLSQAVNDLEKHFISSLGQVELDRSEFVLRKILNEFNRIKQL